MPAQQLPPEPTPDSATAAARARSGLYLLGAKIFRAEADAALLSELLQAPVIEAFAEMQIDITALIPAANDQGGIDLLAQEYTRLFLGPGPHVSPHESVQLKNAGGRLWGKETGVVKRFIEAAGFDYDRTFTGIPDHLSIELEFLGQLARREAEALAAADSKSVAALRQWQYKFLCEHLGRWLDIFTQQVKLSAASEFYPAIARLINEFVATELACLESTAQSSGKIN